MSHITKQQGAGVLKGLLAIPLILVFILILIVAFYEGRKAYWDYQVREMCEKDGGVTVFEKVELTKNEYEEYDGFNGSIVVPNETSAYADRYPYLSTFQKEIIHEDDPSVYRWSGIVYRKSDKKVLGKVVSYHRGGGDFPTIIGHPSGFDCKDMNIKVNVEQQIFSFKEE